MYSPPPQRRKEWLALPLLTSHNSPTSNEGEGEADGEEWGLKQLLDSSGGAGCSEAKGLMVGQE